MQASPSLRTAGLPIACLILYCGLLFFVGLGERDLNSSHEARAAQNAQMILSEGCWGLPRLFDRHLELQKPPLYYWLVAACGLMFGGQVDAWAVRLPAAVSALGCVLFVYYLGRKCGRARAGFLAALVLATSLHFTWLAHVGRIDMPLTLMVTLCGGSFYLAMTAAVGDARRRAWPWYLLAYVSVALGILLKGPIALVLAGVIIAPFALLFRRFSKGTWDGSPEPCDPMDGSGEPPPRTIQSATKAFVRSLWWGMPLVALIAAPWFVWANWQTNNQIWEVFFWYHNLERGLGGSETLASHPPWFYLPRLLVDLFPWSLAVPGAAWYFWRRIGWRHDREASFGAVWFLGVLGLLSCMSFKRADYLLPAYPGIALFLGCMADRYLQARGLRAFHKANIVVAGSEVLRRPGMRDTGPSEYLRPGHVLKWVLAMFLVVNAAGWSFYSLWYVPYHDQGKPYYDLARDIRAHTAMPVIFFRAESHVLAFHVGRPLDTILEWENLDIWASRSFPVYFIMPPDCARDWPQHLTHGRLEEVFRTSDHSWGKRERPLIVMRSRPGAS